MQRLIAATGQKRTTCLALLGGLAIGLTATAARADEAAQGGEVDFAATVRPILEERCYKCHGEKRGLGGLKLHTNELITALEDDGLLVVGDPESSELYTRLTLPDDDKLRMPKGGKRLDEQQVEAVRRWIEQGAVLTSATASAGDKPMAEEHGPDDHGDDHGGHGGPAAGADDALPSPAAASEEALAGLEATGALIVPLFSGSTLLSVGYPSGADSVDDATLDALLPLAENVAWLDLGGTAVTDAGVEKLVALKNLSRLHLEKTAVGDAGAAALAGLARLEYLNLFGANVTDAGLESLGGAPKLTRLYLWQTAVSFDAAKALEAAREGLEVNLGWDHPGVIRDRVTKELARVAAAKAEAEKAAAQAEQELSEAKETLEASTAREAELQAELAALDRPAEEAKPPAPEASGEEPADPSDEAPQEKNKDDDKA